MTLKHGRGPALAASALLAGGLIFASAPQALASPAHAPIAVHSASAGEDRHGSDDPAPMPVMPETYQLADLFSDMSGARLEQAYMAEMIGHHQMAIQMARMELEKGQRPALKALARRIIAAQQQEIDQMTGWLRQWYGVTPEQAMANAPAAVRNVVQKMDSMLQMDMMQMQQVPPPGEATDLAFLQHMIPHHQMAIIETRAALPGFVHPALRQMGRQVITSQSAEVRQMTAWLHAWFGDRDGDR